MVLLPAAWTIGTVKPEAATAAAAPASAAVEPVRNSRRLDGCEESEEEAGLRRAGGLRSVSHGGAPVEGSRIRAGRDPFSPLGLHSC